MRIPELDRRIVFALVGAAVAIPILWKFKFPELPTPMVRGVFERVDSLPAGSRVLLALDYDPGSEAELQPMADAFTRHCAARGVRIYFITLWATGTPMIERTIKEILEQIGRASCRERVYVLV